MTDDPTPSGAELSFPPASAPGATVAGSVATVADSPLPPPETAPPTRKRRRLHSLPLPETHLLSLALPRTGLDLCPGSPAAGQPTTHVA